MCEQWANEGECEANPNYMVGTEKLKGHCRKACGLCAPSALSPQGAGGCGAVAGWERLRSVALSPQGLRTVRAFDALAARCAGCARPRALRVRWRREGARPSGTPSHHRQARHRPCIAQPCCCRHACAPWRGRRSAALKRPSADLRRDLVVPSLALLLLLRTAELLNAHPALAKDVQALTNSVLQVRARGPAAPLRGKAGEQLARDADPRRRRLRARAAEAPPTHRWEGRRRRRLRAPVWAPRRPRQSPRDQRSGRPAANVGERAVHAHACR